MALTQRRYDPDRNEIVTEPKEQSFWWVSLFALPAFTLLILGTYLVLDNPDRSIIDQENFILQNDNNNGEAGIGGGPDASEPTPTKSLMREDPRSTPAQEDIDALPATGSATVDDEKGSR